jgi:hypothetical protein
MISSATIRISPTTFSPMTVTTSTASIISRSMRETRYPCAVAKSASKATSVIGRRIAQTSASAGKATHHDDDCVLAQHSSRGPQKKTLQPRLPTRRHGLDDGQKDDARAEEHAQNRADRRILGQARARDDPLNGRSPIVAWRRPEQKARSGCAHRRPARPS